ncbi:hypothetical protein BC834DRAFT_1037602 [Gloeopeniophorella convolvens]|nr:hypothetical protein BC834DRAFT_1037602 [Gloeopeniophorella convolvens]
MSEYDVRPGGSLKLKGVAEGGIKKKKKPKATRPRKVPFRTKSPSRPPLRERRNSPAIAGSSDDRKTAAEKRFQEVQRKRLADRVKKLAGKTHKDRVHEFNSKLESLSEHHDIPKDRWEALFVYSFITKFTQLRGKVEGFNSPMDFEEALLSHEPHSVMTEILTRFVLNLKPGTRNISTDQISSTLTGVLADYTKGSERTVFWDEDLGVNVDPFNGVDGGFFAADWDTKLKVLRQLVELQLVHSAGVKSLIDRAWGVSHGKHRKKEPTDVAVPDPSDPHSREGLSYSPVGQDSARKRYWVVDGPCSLLPPLGVFACIWADLDILCAFFSLPMVRRSPFGILSQNCGSVLALALVRSDSPRVYLSTNPWKVTSTFQTASSTREEYVTLIEKLKATAPAKPKLKAEFAHQNLISVLEGRLEAIDKEIARIQKARKKVQQRNILLAQAEIRQTRTRRQTHRPDYVYYDPENSDIEKDEEYKFQEDVGSGDEDADFAGSRSDTASASASTSLRSAAAPDAGRRRSTRTAVVSGSAKRTAAEVEPWTRWRGERRSTRLGAPPETQIDEPPSKLEPPVEPPAENPPKVKHSGAAAIKPTEVAMEQIAGRKKSKFWYYAVEPIAGPPIAAPAALGKKSGNQRSADHENGAGHGAGSDFTSSESTAVPHLEGSLSPAPSMDED